MATYVLILGAGDVGWHWHLVEAELRKHGHGTVAPDLPCDDDSVGLSDYADTVVRAIGDRRDLSVVAHSFGSYTAPLVCDRVQAELMVLVAGMVPAPGESAQEMFINTEYQPDQQADSSTLAIYYHDVPPDLAAEALTRSRRQSDTSGSQPWPLAAWPAVPTRFILCRHDRLFPPAWTRRIVRDRLGIVADEIDSGHCPALSRPKELAARFEADRLALWKQS